MEKIIMDGAGISRAITRISYEIIEKNKGLSDICIIGIQRRGVALAKMLSERIEKNENQKIDMGILDITFYRDDLSMLNEHPVLNGTDIPFSIQDKKVILVDDVLYTGRTVRAAIDAIMDLGRPKSIQLAVLIDRGHRELPVHADFVGKNLPTSKKELVKVHLLGYDDTENVTLEEKGE